MSDQLQASRRLREGCCRTPTLGGFDQPGVMRSVGAVRDGAPAPSSCLIHRCLRRRPSPVVAAAGCCRTFRSPDYRPFCDEPAVTGVAVTLLCAVQIVMVMGAARLVVWDGGTTSTPAAVRGWQ